MAHAQKPDLVYQRNGRVHLNRRGFQFSRLLAADACASAVVMLDRPSSDTVQDCWLPTPFAYFPFTSPPVRHRVPSDSERAIPLIPSNVVWSGLVCASSVLLAQFLILLMMGAVTPETCRVALQWINICVLSHLLDFYSHWIKMHGTTSLKFAQFVHFMWISKPTKPRLTLLAQIPSSHLEEEEWNILEEY